MAEFPIFPPTDKDLRAAAGDVAMAHGLLELTLQLMVMSLSGITGPEARKATRFVGARDLRRMIQRLAKSQGLDEPARLKINALLDDARRVTEKRNDMIHRPWGEVQGKTVTTDDADAWGPTPTAPELMALANEIWKVAAEIQTARLAGFIREAIQNARVQRGLDGDK